jgi:hypothetical protein
MAAVLIGCASSHPSVSPTTEGTSVALAQAPECYRLAYNDSSGGTESRLFPASIEIFPGSDSGAVAGSRHPTVSAADWQSVLKYRRWRRIAGDSLEIMFTGDNEGIRIHVARSNGSLSGRAAWLTDVIGLRTPSLAVVGTRVSCPVAGPG